jgi:hypothetical protein
MKNGNIADSEYAVDYAIRNWPEALVSYFGIQARENESIGDSHPRWSLSLMPGFAADARAVVGALSLHPLLHALRDAQKN